jgi:hypothetical protein
MARDRSRTRAGARARVRDRVRARVRARVVQDIGISKKGEGVRHCYWDMHMVVLIIGCGLVRGSAKN